MPSYAIWVKSCFRGGHLRYHIAERRKVLLCRIYLFAVREGFYPERGLMLQAELAAAHEGLMASMATAELPAAAASRGSGGKTTHASEAPPKL